MPICPPQVAATCAPTPLACDASCDRLGPYPGEALTAMVAYGLNDVEIGRYYGIASEAVLRLRRAWGIRRQA